MFVMPTSYSRARPFVHTRAARVQIYDFKSRVLDFEPPTLHAIEVS
jgi:hypothetical protein